MRKIFGGRNILYVILSLLLNGCSLSRISAQEIPNNIRVLLDTLPPLSYDRGGRELLYQYSIGDLSSLSHVDAERVVSELALRGVGVITFWGKGKDMEPAIEEGIRIARIQEKLGLAVVVDASRLLYGFYDGTSSTAHIDAQGNAFTDSSFAGQTMGCSFTLNDRESIIRSRVVAYVEAYHTAGIVIDILTADWELDGPHEWNMAWANSMRCIRCREQILNINDFKAFQSIMRSMRSKLMNKCYSSPVLQRFPNALITNYATYPNNGWRYWYDYFEYPQPALPHIKDQEALYRPWYDEFVETGFTLSMPVVYTWYPIFNWYPEYSPDYRWFYNMLKVGSNAGEFTPSGIPIATFVHWHTTAPPENPDSNVKQMSMESYKELLWHLLLRGHDILFSWCMRNELATEMSLIQEVYNSSLKYNEWFKSGRPVIFDVPVREGSVISGLKMNDKVLVRRTDFTENKEPVIISVDGIELSVPAQSGECQILSFEMINKQGI